MIGSDLRRPHVRQAAPLIRSAGGPGAASYTSGMARKRIQFRPPGLKPTTKVGTLGPYRGRLGLAWVIAPLVVGVVILVGAYLAFAR